jgi:hypothetical protein
MLRQCSRCGELKDEAKFRLSFSGKSRRNYCCACGGRYEVARLKVEMFEALGFSCACCGENNPLFLSLDHKIEGDGPEQRKRYDTPQQLIRAARREGWPKDKYQVLCYNCNCAKGFFGVCPHQSGKSADDILGELRTILAWKGVKHRNYQEKLKDPDYKEVRPWKSEEMMGNAYAAGKGRA